jgi:hypothetical protein
LIGELIIYLATADFGTKVVDIFDFLDLFDASDGLFYVKIGSFLT